MRDIYWREGVEAEAWEARRRLTIGAEVGLALRRTRYDVGLCQRAYAAERGWSIGHLAQLEAHGDEVRMGAALEALAPTGFGIVVLPTDHPARLVPVPQECAPEPPPKGFRRPAGEEGPPSVRRLDALAAEPKGHGLVVTADPDALVEDVRRAVIDARDREGISRRQQAGRLGLTEPTLRRRERDASIATVADVSHLLKECGQSLQLIVQREGVAVTVLPWEWPSSELVAKDRRGVRRFPGHRGAQPAGWLGPIWWWMSGEGGNSLRGMPRWESGPDPRWR